MQTEFRQRLIERCIQDLEAVGATFRVVVDGHEYGDLNAPVILQPEPKDPPKNKYSWREYTEVVRMMEPGDALDFEPKHGEPLRLMAAGISAAGTAAFGKGNFTTVSNAINNTVTAKRLA